MWTRDTRCEFWFRRGNMKRFSVGSCMRGYHVYNGTQLAKKSHNKTLLVQILTCGDSAAMWVENFGGGKFCDTWVNHRKKTTTKISTPREYGIITNVYEYQLVSQTSVNWCHLLIYNHVHLWSDLSETLLILVKLSAWLPFPGLHFSQSTPLATQWGTSLILQMLSVGHQRPIALKKNLG